MPATTCNLVLEASSPSVEALPQSMQSTIEQVRVDAADRSRPTLHQQQSDHLTTRAQPADSVKPAEEAVRAERIVAALADGVALVTPDLRIMWANTVFETWCAGTPIGRSFYEALGSPELLGPDFCPFHTAAQKKARVSTRLLGRTNRSLELQITPLLDSEGIVTQLIAIGHDVTEEAQKQQKLDALHKAGQELAALSPSDLSEMSVAERVEVLKLNIHRLTRDLLHYDVVEIRLLNQRTGHLEPLVQEGMTAKASGRPLSPTAEGNGITGLVAATGKSYLCCDTTADLRYLEGSEGARSSMTVPLIIGEKIIGTFNVESPKLNAFGDEDLRFAEIFSREIAVALNTLQLLNAEKESTAWQSIEAISRAVALPVDEILTSATTVLDRYVGHDPELEAKLRHILESARLIKSSVQKVGEDIAPTQSLPRPGETAHPALKGLRLLVADNDERVRRSAHCILGRFGCVVETARECREAMTLARLSNYDAILVDIRLPDLSGYEAYRRMREAQPKAQVILMTAYGYDPAHTIVKARQDGLRFVLFKPFRVDQLIEALEKSAGISDLTVKNASEK